jgi:hypothetical protein
MVTNVVSSKVVQRLGYFDLLLSIEKGIGKLLAFSKGTLDNLKTRDVAKEIADRLVGISGLMVWVLAGVNASIARMICTLLSEHGHPKARKLSDCH